MVATMSPRYWSVVPGDRDDEILDGLAGGLTFKAAAERFGVSLDKIHALLKAEAER